MIFEQVYVEALYKLLEPLKDIEQDKQWHPEENCFEHSFQCLVRDHFALLDNTPLAQKVGQGNQKGNYSGQRMEWFLIDQEKVKLAE